MKEYEERIVNDVAHKRHKSSKVRFTEMSRTVILPQPRGLDRPAARESPRLGCCIVHLPSFAENVEISVSTSTWDTCYVLSDHVPLPNTMLNDYVPTVRISSIPCFHWSTFCKFLLTRHFHNITTSKCHNVLQN
jgi:hypothetical protein